ncbi:hypothetical protein HPB50_019723 [Hyalomma asiaticum]|uniref:Uncharacterized protein n=1 Tax=Hyalomma asiaticum TaxID=266040 RepID=A0ACB7S9U2_HYAAI|nr:hypothetical protein HPB50_019723 [Hyalomma asiaticum]
MVLGRECQALGAQLECLRLNDELQRSNNGTVFIRNVDHLTGGNYKCEVSADAPSFKTMFVEKLIRIDSSSTCIQVPPAMALLLLALATRVISQLVSNR